MVRSGPRRQASEEDSMNRIIFLLLAAAVLNGCSAPKSPEPKGEWMPVNRVPAQSGNAQ